MIVNEIFYSLQGEGQLAGVPSVFIRLAGCPLRCCWCDTKYAWDPQAGDSLSPPEVVEQIKEYPSHYVVVTGGEPMAHNGIAELLNLLNERGYHITVETAGIEYISNLPVDLMSISPKLSNSIPADSKQAKLHEPYCFRPTVVESFIATYDYQLKFVIDEPADLNEVAECIGKLEDIHPYKIYLMPQATRPEDYLEKSRWLADYCLQTGFAFSPRLQVILWPGQRGK